MAADTPAKTRGQFDPAGRAAYAVAEAASGGRAVAEAEHPYRSCFQRDRDRIVHCTAFRRLDFKTQVFVPHEHDHFRTRLTHTLEVAQIGRDLARALGLNEDIVEAVALGHDLGHPPFGHSGEAALDKLMAGSGGFEHNRQSLRVVDFLEHPYPRFAGLNLTRVVRECIAMHEGRYDAGACEEFAGEPHAPLEGQLVDLADEIAYTAADLDDALAAGWITAGQLGQLALWREAWRAAGEPDRDRCARAAKAVLAAMADDLLAATAANIREMCIDSPDAARAAERKAVAFSPPMRGAVDEMHDFLMQAVYLHPANVEHGSRARAIIRELFDACLADTSLLPERYRSRIGPEPDTSLHRVVCDYVAGMTDRFCRQEHARICGE